MSYSPGRYLRLFAALGRFSLLNELAFRVNFLIKLFVELLWFSILMLFYDQIIFRNADEVAGWSREQYLFFVGCHYALGGLVETFFLENLTGFADLVRSGDLDIYLLRPIDEQFLISFRHVDWSTFPNVLQGAGVMVYALAATGWQFDAGRLLLFLGLFACGCAMTYSFLVMLCTLSVWLIRNQSLMEMWWLFTTVMRYPREVFGSTPWGRPVGAFFTLVVPVLLIVSVPADVMVRVMQPWFVAGMLAATAALLLLSRAFFRRALRSYRSASS